MIYLAEEKLLIASYWDSTIRIYDEEDSEESVLLKVLLRLKIKYLFNTYRF